MDTYAQRNPEEISRIYGLNYLLQEDRAAFLKRFFRASPNIEGIQSGYHGQG